MTTRRDFIKTAGAATACVFTSCSLLDAAHAQGKSAGKRRQVMIKGKRVRTIDVHAHIIFMAAVELLGAEKESVFSPVKGSREQANPIEERIAAMDVQGIDMEALSINPFWYRKERDLAGQICKVQNEKLAEVCAQHPDRFVAFASLPLQFPDLAVQQLEEGIKKLGLRGAAIGGSVAGMDFSDPKFHPVWAKAEELGVLLFIHPQSTPELNNRFKGNGWLANTIGNPLDTTIALSHLIYEGTLDKFPGLKVCAAHGGGYLPSYAPRMDHSCFVSPANCNPNIVLKKKPTEYLNQLYFDSLVFTPEALRHIIAQVGASQIVIGTDHPIPWQEKSVDHVLSTPGLTDAQRIAILGGTAAKLLGIKS
jgi:predicted TIM-barrel fold metal-dependent hydrolase